VPVPEDTLLLAVGNQLIRVVFIESDLELVHQFLMANLTHDNRHVLSAFEGVNPQGVMGLPGNERNKFVVATDIQCLVALGRFTLESAYRVSSLCVPLDDHRVFPFVRGDDEALVSGHCRTGDDVHVALELDVLFLDLVLNHSSIRRGVE